MQKKEINDISAGRCFNDLTAIFTRHVYNSQIFLNYYNRFYSPGGYIRFGRIHV